MYLPFTNRATRLKENIPTLNLKLHYIKKMLVSLNILHAISEKPLNLGNKIACILEQNQDISAGLSLTSFKYMTKIR